MRRGKRITGIIIVIIILLVESFTAVNAMPIGEDAEVAHIKYQIIRDADYNITKAFIEFTGENLLNKTVLFSTNDGTKSMGKREIHLGDFVQYNLTPEEVKIFTGTVRIGNKSFNLGLDTFPIIERTTKIVNVDSVDPTENTLEIKGRNLDQIGKASGDYKIKGEYGRIGQYKPIDTTNEESNDTTIKIVNATPYGDKGLQSIRLIKEKRNNKNPDPIIEIEYSYNNVFSFIGDIPIGNDKEIEVYPNTGIREDQFYLRSGEFDKAYDVYFFKTLDGTEGFSEKNKAIRKGFVPKSATSPKALLTVEVPKDAEFGANYLVLAETINGQVVAQKVIAKPNAPTDYIIYTVVDAGTKANITNVHPATGPDIGGTPVSIEGRNLLTSSIPAEELVIDYSQNEGSITLEGNKQRVVVRYNDAKYNGKDATVTRSIKVQIGKTAIFQETDGEPRVEIGVTDRLFVVTSKIDDASTSPNKEVFLEITTVVTESGPNGSIYTFEENVRWMDDRGEIKYFVFTPSSLTPEIVSVTPQKIELINNKLEKELLLSIKGGGFLVNRYMDSNGETIINYPGVLIKTANDIDTNNYEVMIKKGIDGKTKAYYRDTNGLSKETEGAEITVLDDADRITDGTVGREIGTRILVKIPKGIESTTGVKHLQISNPTRQSIEPGQSGIALDAIEFIETDNSPEIDEVIPDIVPIYGGVDIIVTGSNFLEGIKVFIDGREVTGVTRDISLSGNQYILKFKAPKGREGATQILVQNPSGGTDSKEFYYVETLQKDPKIINFSPNKGGKDTLVYIKGDNFLKPDPTVKDISGMGIYRLMGTRILFDGKDANEYNLINGKIELKDYVSSEEIEPLIKIGSTVTSVELADYYNSVMLKDNENNRYYTLDFDVANKIILSDGIQNKYIITGHDNGIFKANKGGAEYSVEFKKGSGTISDKLEITNGTEIITLDIMTPYKVEDGIITGNRVKILNRSEIMVNVPHLGENGWYSIAVQNPDTKMDTRTEQNGFYYFKQPATEPVITEVVPSEGAVGGGYFVNILGKGFEDNGTYKSRVIIGGVEIPEEDVVVGTDGNSITITRMPAYPGDLKAETETGRKTVPVVIVNSDGGNTKKTDGFTYVIPTSNPEITEIKPAKGNAAGGEIVRIIGVDFRFFEPYKDENKIDFNDINGDTFWTDLGGKGIEDLTNDDKKILPGVYFGKKKAEIIEFSRGYLVIKLPEGEQGVVDVYVQNNDGGMSNKVKFTYLASNPTIREIRPPVGKKQGMDKVTIYGFGFVKSNVDIYKEIADSSGVQNIESVNMPLVHFGNVNDVTTAGGLKTAYISNRNIPVLDSNGLGGAITNGRAGTKIGNIDVNYDATGSDKKVTFSITEDGKTYKFVISGYDDSIKYVDIRSLKDDEENLYINGYELIRVEVDAVDRKLIAERGYAPYNSQSASDDTEITLYIPSHYAIGEVPVTVTNPDGGTATGNFEYKNPDSDPQITNITRDGQQPQLANDGENKILTVNVKGGSIITIEGRDFRDVRLIQIGNILNIGPGDVLEEGSDKLVFKMPPVGDNALAYLHKVVVINYDGGTASSDATVPEPIYIQFVKGESNPQIESIVPPRGSSTGGNTVIINGKDFRETMEGYNGEKLKVYFDGKQVPEKDVEFIDYKTISVTAPPGVPGSVEVKVENPDGEMSNIAEYTYASNPRITSVVDPLDPTGKAVISIVSIEGNQEIGLKGMDFMEGATVYFAPKVIPVTGNEGSTGKIIYIEGIPHILEEGTEGTEYNFIDNETVTIKTPPLKVGSSGVIIVNSDGGASPIYTSLTYGLPEIATPSWIAAELVYDRFIRVHWGAVSGVTEYEIFVVIGGRTAELIGSTGLTSFAYSDLQPRTSYRFIVKAVGNFGSSKPSMESNTVKTGKVVGPPDEDGGLAEGTSMTKTGDVVSVVIGTKDKGIAPMVIDLTEGSLAGSTGVVISMPASVIVQSGNRNVQVMGKDFLLNFRPSAFNTAIVKENSTRSDAGVRFIVAPDKGNTQIASGNGLSTVYNLDATIYVGKANTAMDYLAGPLSLTLNYDLQKANLRKLNYAGFSHFNPETNGWQSIGSPTDTVVNHVSGTVNRLGRYAVIGSR